MFYQSLLSKRKERQNGGKQNVNDEMRSGNENNKNVNKKKIFGTNEMIGKRIGKMRGNGILPKRSFGKFKKILMSEKIMLQKSFGTDTGQQVMIPYRKRFKKRLMILKRSLIIS